MCGFYIIIVLVQLLYYDYAWSSLWTQTIPSGWIRRLLLFFGKHLDDFLRSIAHPSYNIVKIVFSIFGGTTTHWS